MTVGSHPRCTVVISEAKLPARRFEIFSPRTGGYALQFTGEMHGKVAVGDKVVTLASLAQKGQAKKKGSWFELTLGPTNRGKVYVGEYTFLFQFVAPPPQPMRARGGDFRAFRWEDVDWLFFAIVLFSALLHTAVVIWIESQPPPKKVRLEDLPDRFVKMLLPPEEEPKPVDENVEGESDEVVEKEAETPAPVEEPAEEPAGSDEPEEPQESPEEKRARLEEEAASKGLLALIGTAGDSSREGAVADLLSDGSGLADDVGEALANSSGVVIGRRDVDQAGLRGGGGGDGAAGIGDLGGAGGDKGGAVVKEAKAPKAVMDTGSVDIGSSEDAASVRSTMKRYNARIRACYEKELKSNPDLGGKVTAYWIITPSGSPSDVDIVGNSTGNAALGQCIAKELKRIKFPAPEDDIEVDGYNWVFSSQ
ncbi:MAG: AgmX/PglI C-terminal domain-containing protein [Deltaproteobacteria bacterium]|nr:AgmX/PglI C-terminal domain-containing protein [Deltaproteobacteria bacterium]